MSHSSKEFEVARRSNWAAYTTWIASILAGLAAAVVTNRTNSGEWLGLIVSSGWIAGIVFVLTRVLPQPLYRAPRAIRILAAFILGIGIGVANTGIAFALSGGFILASDFPVLLCWSVGAVNGLSLSLVPGVWRLLPIGAAVALAGLLLKDGIAEAQIPQPALRAYLAADATSAQAESLWVAALSAHFADSTGSASPQGASMALATNVSRGRVLTFEFNPRTDSLAIERFAAALRDQRIIDRVERYLAPPTY